MSCIYDYEINNFFTFCSSTRKEYGDEAIGHVQVQLQSGTAVVKAKVTPEHKVRQTPYNVTVEIDTVSEEVKEARCHGCQARNGGCKHVAAFVLWLHRRSSDPAVTEVKCYWKKARLSNVANLSPVKASSFGSGSQRRPAAGGAKQGNFLDSCVEYVREVGLQPAGVVFRMVDTESEGVSDVREAYMDVLCSDMSVKDLVGGRLAGKVSKQLIELVCSETAEQSSSPLWHHVRYGRITASKVYEVSQCKTVQGSLVETILGARKFKGTTATRRGQHLEAPVLTKLSQVRGVKVQRTGLHIVHDKPMFAASPDALTNDHGQLCVIEVKCPSAAKTVSQYVGQQGITPKVRAQLQLQMIATGAKKGLLCVGDPLFEENGEISVFEDELDMQFIQPIMERAERFWVHAVLPMLLKE